MGFEPNPAPLSAIHPPLQGFQLCVLASLCYQHTTQPVRVHCSALGAVLYHIETHYPLYPMYLGTGSYRAKCVFIWYRMSDSNARPPSS